MRRVHPLNALRAFEASARHLNFVRAAEELNVTPAAISHQVKKLEAYLGVQLFNRQSRGITLTIAGDKLLFRVSDAFDRLDAAVESLLLDEGAGALTLSVAPAFAIKWLIPRLSRFKAQYPDIDVRISSSTHLADFNGDGFDAAIRLGSGDYPGLHAEFLFNETVTPMCSPRLIEGARPISHPKDLTEHTLLHDDSIVFGAEQTDWATWFEKAGIQYQGTVSGPRFDQPNHAIQAAIDGTGVALGWRRLAGDDIAARRLIEPFSLELPMQSSFYFVYPRAFKNRKKIRFFQNWILKELSPV